LEGREVGEGRRVARPPADEFKCIIELEGATDAVLFEVPGRVLKSGVTAPALLAVVDDSGSALRTGVVFERGMFERRVIRRL
jgi:hypothetical protein